MSLKTPFFPYVIWKWFSLNSLFKYKLYKFPSSSFFSLKIVTPLIVSLNFWGFIKLLKKFTSEVLIKDLAKSWEVGTKKLWIRAELKVV